MRAVVFALSLILLASSVVSADLVQALDSQDDVEAAFAEALQAESEDEEAAKPKNVKKESTEDLAAEARERAQSYTKVGRDAEKAGAKVMARKQIPAIVAAAQKKQAHNAAIASAKRNAKNAAKKKAVAAHAASEARKVNERNAKAYTKKHRSKKQAGAHEEKALKVELKQIKAKKKRKVALKEAALQADEKKVASKGEAERAALKVELGHMKKESVKMTKKLKKNVKANLEKQAEKRTNQALLKQKQKAKAPNSEKVLKAELRSIHVQRAKKIAAAHKKLHQELMMQKAKEGAGGASQLDDLLNDSA